MAPESPISLKIKCSDHQPGTRQNGALTPPRARRHRPPRLGCLLLHLLVLVPRLLCNAASSRAAVHSARTTLLQLLNSCSDAFVMVLAVHVSLLSALRSVMVSWRRVSAALLQLARSAP